MISKLIVPYAKCKQAYNRRADGNKLFVWLLQTFVAMKREADGGEMGSPHKRFRRGDEEVRLLIPSKVS